MPPAAANRWARAPHILASTFQDYDLFGHAYAALAEPKVQATQAIQNLAQSITSGVSDRREQARLLYNWVSRHIRYVSISLGIGGWVPHDSGAILQNGYGDCKDHAVLLAALLQAKDIPADLVLVNTEPEYELEETPSLAAFDHMIVYLPEFDLYADSTAGVAPFGTLPFREYGKPVLLVRREGKVIQRVPSLPPNLAASHHTAVSMLDWDDKFAGQSTTEATGPLSNWLREEAQSIEAKGADRYARDYFESHDRKGTASFSYGPPKEIAPSYSLSSDYFQSDNEETSGKDGFWMRAGVRMLPEAGDELMGSLGDRDLPASEPTPCYSGHQIEDLSLVPPPGTKITELPADLNVQTSNLEFSLSLESQRHRGICPPRVPFKHRSAALFGQSPIGNAHSTRANGG
jgi:hypothetical protein